VVLVSTQKPDVDDNEIGEGTEERGAFEQVVGFRGVLNIEIVGSGPEDLIFDSAPVRYDGILHFRYKSNWSREEDQEPWCHA